MSFFLPPIIWAFIDSLISICSMAIRNNQFIRIGLILFSSFVRSNKCTRYLTYCTIDVKINFFYLTLFSLCLKWFFRFEKKILFFFFLLLPLLQIILAFIYSLTHFVLWHFLDLGKQCRPRSDAAERSVWSGSTLFASFAYRNQIWK